MHAAEAPFAEWFEELPHTTAAKISTALYRMELGNFSNAKSVGMGVQEYRVDYGPGYRIYFGRAGDEVIILLAGGTKRRQQSDIAQARKRWDEYKSRKGV